MGKRRFTEGTWKKDTWFRALSSTLVSLKTEADMAAFLRDIGTLSELQAWSERLEVARELTRGMSYREVAMNTGASTATVTRVAKFLESGSGYRSVLGGQKHHRHSSSLRGERMASMK